MQKQQHIRFGALSASLAILFLPGTLLCIWLTAKFSQQWVFPTVLCYMFANWLLVAFSRRRDKRRFYDFQNEENLSPTGEK